MDKPTNQTLPPDDLRRGLTVSSFADDSGLRHIGLAGDTYTITVDGEATAGQFCVIDMHIPPDGGPAAHRHDFEETFVVLEGEIQATFRGETTAVRAGDTINIPANAPHQFRNAASEPARLLCVCSPSGQEEFFARIGVPVATRTTPPPALDEAQQAELVQKIRDLAPLYKTEFVEAA